MYINNIWMQFFKIVAIRLTESRQQNLLIYSCNNMNAAIFEVIQLNWSSFISYWILVLILVQSSLSSTAWVSLTSTGSGNVIPPRWAIGVDGPTDTDVDLCILLLLVRCTVKLTVPDSVKTKDKRKKQFNFRSKFKFTEARCTTWTDKLLSVNSDKW